MHTFWQDKIISNDFEAYNDVLEQTLGYPFIYEGLAIKGNNPVLLDYGCGTGKPAYNLIKRYDCTIIAVDESDEMLLIAQVKRKHPCIKYKKVVNDNLYYVDDSSLDGALLCFVLLNHGSEQRIIAILKEINRVLKPGAACMILETHPDSVGLKFSTFQSGIENKVYHYGESREAWLFLPSGKELVLAGYHWPKEMYYQSLVTAGFHHYIEQAPILKNILNDKLQKYSKSNKKRQHHIEWSRPPFIIFKAIKSLD